jgi:hypothetical protein
VQWATGGWQRRDVVQSAAVGADLPRFGGNSVEVNRVVPPESAPLGEFLGQIIFLLAILSRLALH